MTRKNIEKKNVRVHARLFSWNRPVVVLAGQALEYLKTVRAKGARNETEEIALELHIPRHKHKKKKG